MTFGPLAMALLSFGAGFSLPPEQDKMKHLAIGTGTATLVREYTDNPLAGCGAPIALGLAKEGYDHFTGGHVEGIDALATGLGCAMGFRF